MHCRQIYQTYLKKYITGKDEKDGKEIEVDKWPKEEVDMANVSTPPRAIRVLLPACLFACPLLLSSHAN